MLPSTRARFALFEPRGERGPPATDAPTVALELGAAALAPQSFETCGRQAHIFGSRVCLQPFAGGVGRLLRRLDAVLDKRLSDCVLRLEKGRQTRAL
jgi:hypothetical protein